MGSSNSARSRAALRSIAAACALALAAIPARASHYIGGSNSIAGTLVLANNPSSTGLYSMSAGSLTATTLTSGSSGNGAFSSTGGTITVGNAATQNGTLNVGLNATSTSTFKLDSTSSL